MDFKAFAKINIGLRVLKKRTDGFHDIETFFQQINLHDVMEIEPSLDGQIHTTCSNKTYPEDSGNLALRADHLLKNKLCDAS